jgi:hypothetical protein
VGNGGTSSFQNRQPSGSSNPQRGSNSRGFNNRGRYDSVSFMRSIRVKKCETIVASRLRKFARQWFQFTNDPWVLGVVSNGLKLGLIERPVQFWRSNGSSEISFYH